MHYAAMDVPTAISTAKSLRPIIDPIGQLPEFLHRFKRAQDYRKQQGIQATSTSSKPVEGEQTTDTTDTQKKIFVDILGDKF
jgi:hypothetical protein